MRRNEEDFPLAAFYRYILMTITREITRTFHIKDDSILDIAPLRLNGTESHGGASV